MSKSKQSSQIYEPQVYEDEEKTLIETMTNLSAFISEDDETEYPAEEKDGITDLTDFSCVIVVDNMPISHKVKKLEQVMRRVFGQIGTINNLELPTDEDKSGTMKTIGIALLEFASKEQATSAVKKINGWKLDKRHTFVVNHYADVHRYLQMPDEYKDPSHAEFQKNSPVKLPLGENLLTWLTDKFQRDQFVVRHNNNTEVHWCEYNPTPPVLVYDGSEQKKEGKNWCELYVNWSPQGTYLATFHHPGIALWGGKGFNKLMRFSHSGVQFLTFSPKENYMITWNGQTGDKASQAIKVFNVKTGQCMRPFSYTFVPEQSQWPNFKWSADDSYIARLDRQKDNDLICVYSVPQMNLLDQKSIRAPNVTTFSWSPTDNVLAYWSPEDGNTPARITLQAIPSRKILKQKNLFNVVDCKMHWHPQGHFLCVQVTRHTRTKKKTFTNFEIFRMRDPDVPVENFELKERVDDFAWEKNDGVRFGIVHSDSETRANVSFYTMTKLVGGDKLDFLHTHTDRPCNKLYWSTMGNYLVIAGQKSPHNGVLEFYDCDAEESLATHEHFMCTGVEWGPSGRICASVVSQAIFDTPSMRHQLESGYRLWSFQGTSLHQVQQQQFYSFEWRPRPTSLLTGQARADVLAPKNIKEQKEKFRSIDKLLKNSREAMEARKMIIMRNKFREDMQKLRDELSKDHSKRVATLGYDDTDETKWNLVTEDYSEIIESREDVVNE